MKPSDRIFGRYGSCERSTCARRMRSHDSPAIRRRVCARTPLIPPVRATTKSHARVGAKCALTRNNGYASIQDPCDGSRRCRSACRSRLRHQHHMVIVYCDISKTIASHVSPVFVGTTTRAIKTLGRGNRSEGILTLLRLSDFLLTVGEIKSYDELATRRTWLVGARKPVAKWTPFGLARLAHGRRGAAGWYPTYRGAIPSRRGRSWGVWGPTWVRTSPPTTACGDVRGETR